MVTPAFKIKITSPAGPRTVALQKSSASIGAAAHCDVRLSHPSVDFEHARAWFEGGRLWVQDLGSTAGTYLNGSRLPAMKPMLVRDLDALRIGESAETLGFERPTVDLVRAPRVAPVPVMDEATLTEIRLTPTTPAAPVADDARVRLERARVSRELAEMRLQLQMGQLEKNGVVDLRAQVNELRAELSRLEDERREHKSNLVKTLTAEAARQTQVEAELTERRARVERELSEMRDAEGRKLGQWKIDIVNTITHQVRGVLAEKAQAWAKRPFGRDMARELEGDLGSMIHALVLEEQSHGGKVAEITRSHALQSPPPPTPQPKSARLRHVAGAGVLVAMVGVGLEFYRARSSDAGTRQPASVQTAAVLDRVAKTSLTDNVLKTAGYPELIQSPAWRKARTADLQKAPWSFDAPTIQTLLGREAALVRDLVTLRDRAAAGADASAALHAREAEFSRVLLASFGNDPAILERYVSGRTATLQRLLAR